MARRRLAANHDNLRAALAWGEQHDPELMLRLAGNLWRFWWANLTEGRAWLERALVAGGDEGPGPLRVKALGSASIVASMQGRSDAARFSHERPLSWPNKVATARGGCGLC